MTKTFLERCADAVLLGDKDGAAELANETVAGDHDVLTVVENGFSAGVRAAGVKWEQGDYFLPELAFAAEAMKAAMAILQPQLAKDGGGKRKGRILIGTVQGDIHDIGKSLVTTLLLANNYEVFDLGSDVPHTRFLEEVERLQPDVLGMSALLTTTMSGQGEVIRLLEQRDLRAKVKVLVGGAPTTADWAREIGADGHGENAVAAVQALDAMLSRYHD
jgi:corrinoid protein of di/trimethylamine methyltransferase